MNEEQEYTKYANWLKREMRGLLNRNSSRSVPKDHTDHCKRPEQV